MSDPTAADTGWTWYRPMRARSADERARSSTELELLFDLCFVIAVAQAAAAFEHEVTSGRIGHGVLGYAMVFFAIWWAWMNFTWFASAYDTDDVFYRLLTLVQIGGALIMAAGAARALDDSDFVLVAMGYVVMRLAMVAQWLRAAYSDRERRTSSLRYAAGIFLIQIGWVIVAFGVIPDLPVAFVVLAVGELAIPPGRSGPRRPPGTLSTSRSASACSPSSFSVRRWRLPPPPCVPPSIRMSLSVMSPRCRSAVS